MIVLGESGAAVLPRVVAVGRAPDGTFTRARRVAQSAGAYRRRPVRRLLRRRARPGRSRRSSGSPARWAPTSRASVAGAPPSRRSGHGGRRAPPPVSASRAARACARYTATGRAGKAMRLVYRGARRRLGGAHASRRAHAESGRLQAGRRRRSHVQAEQLYSVLVAADEEAARDVHVLRARRLGDRAAVAAELLDASRFAEQQLEQPLRVRRRVGASSCRK